MKVEIITNPDGSKTAVLTCPLQKPELSSSGKSNILFSSHGFVKPIGVLYEGKQVSVGINIIAALR